MAAKTIGSSMNESTRSNAVQLSLGDAIESIEQIRRTNDERTYFTSGPFMCILLGMTAYFVSFGVMVIGTSNFMLGGVILAAGTVCLVVVVPLLLEERSPQTTASNRYHSTSL